MSHELRTPLNSILGFAELTHEGKDGQPEADHQVEYPGAIPRACADLLQLIDDVLDLSKVGGQNGRQSRRDCR